MKIRHAIRRGDVIEILYRGRVLTGKVIHSDCSKIPQVDLQIPTGFDLGGVEFINAASGLSNYWKPDIDEGGGLRRVTYGRPLCPQCCDSARVKEVEHAFWCCLRCGWKGEVGAFVIEDVYK